MVPTIYDIARVANVSKSTVSRVLNNQQNISEEARSRVLKAMEELNYHPNKLARALSSGFDAIMVISRSTKTTANNPFFSEILYSISKKAEEENFDVVLQTSKNAEDELAKCISKIKEKMIKGIIMLTSPANESFFEQLDIFNIPIVVVGKVEGEYNNIYSIDTNNYQDSYDLTEFLIKQGHRDIACLHSTLDYHVSIDRLEGYINCLKDYGITPREELVVNSGVTIEEAYKSTKELLTSQRCPTAVFATDDLKVMSVYRVCSEEKIAIPRDISVVGYSNPSYSPFLLPALTRIEIPVRKLGEVGTHLLFNQIKNNKKNSIQRSYIPTSIVIQDSVAKT
jgi:DNA-binding LacI/PurR family transcriptional regulator